MTAMRVPFSKSIRLSLLQVICCMLGLCLAAAVPSAAQSASQGTRSHRARRHTVAAHRLRRKRHHHHAVASTSTSSAHANLASRATSARRHRSSARLESTSLRRTRHQRHSHIRASNIVAAAAAQQRQSDHAAMIAAEQQAAQAQAAQSAKLTQTLSQPESPLPAVENASAIPAAESASTTENAPEIAPPANRTSSAHLTHLTMQPERVAIPRYIPAPMRGSHEVLVHQNIIATVEGLRRIQNDAQIQEMLAEKRLVSLPVSSMLQVDSRLPVNRRYCRPWTADFLSNLANAHAALFHHPFIVTSAVRTVHFQEHLERINGNAAPASGDTASPHLTGQAIDIGKKGMSMREIGWMRAYLGPLQDAGKLDVEEEFQQSCFHISVYKTYEPEALPSGDLIARVDVPHLIPTAATTAPRYAAPAHATPARVSRRSYRRRRRHHVYASMLAARMR